MAEKVLDIAAKNAAIATAIEVTQSRNLKGEWQVINNVIIKTVYNGTPQDSPARRLVTNMYSALSLKEILKDVRGIALHQDYNTDLAKILDETRPRKKGCGGNMAARNGVQAYLEEI
jgi:hypothetical protein